MTILAVLLSSSTVSAKETNLNLWYGINEVKEGVDENLGYSINNPAANVGGEINAAKLWNIVKYTNESTNDPTDVNNVYCVKAGVGFSDSRRKALKENTQ